MRVWSARLWAHLAVGVLPAVVLVIRHDVLLHLGGVLQPAVGRQRVRVSVNDVQVAPAAENTALC